LVSRDYLDFEVCSPLGVGEALCVLEAKQDTRNVQLLSYITQASNAKDFVDGGLRVNDNLLNTITTDTHETTEFVEGESKVLSTELNNVTTNNYEIRGESIQDFLHKPILIQNFLWSTSSAADTNLFVLDIGPQLTSNAMWARKIEGYELIRGTFHFRVQINASPFMQGRALIHYIPNYADRVITDPQFALRYNSHIVQKFQHPHIELDLQDTVAEIAVPYVAPSAYYDLKTGKYDWGRIWMDVIAPLEVGPTALNPNAEVSIFGYWTDIELAAAIVPQSKKLILDFTPQSKRMTKDFMTLLGDDVEKQEDKGLISYGLSQVARAADSLSEVPLLAPVMTPVAWAIRAGSVIASIFGWSKPLLEDKPVVMLNSAFRYIGNSTGHDTSQSTALVHDNRTEVTDEYSIRSQDEMSLKFLLSVPTYMGMTNWTTSNSSNDLLFQQLIVPQLFRYDLTQVGSTHTTNYSVGAPLWYLSNFFALYRGSMNVILKIVKTKFHSGKLLITFTPLDSNTPSAPDTVSSCYSLRTIVDIREQNEIKLNLPYMVYKTYLESTSAIGLLQVRVLNVLRCPETCPQDIKILKYYVAGDDFEFQVPSVTGNIGAGIYTPQSKSLIINNGIGASKKQTCNTLYSSKCIGEHFTSLKQFLNRVSQLQPRVAQTYTGKNYAFYPYAVTGLTSNATTGALVGDDFAADAFSFFAPMYAYFRGNVRISWKTSNTVESGIAQWFFKNYTSAAYLLDTTSLLSIGSNTVVTANVGLDKSPVQPTVQYDTGASSWTFFRGVYQNIFPVSFVHVWQGQSTNYYDDDTTPGTCIITSSQVNTAFGVNTTLKRSFCDDFQLTFFIACPPLFRTNAAN
jgi:hypothetical protein